MDLLLGCHDNLHILLRNGCDCALELTRNSEFNHHHMQDLCISNGRHYHTEKLIQEKETTQGNTY